MNGKTTNWLPHRLMGKQPTGILVDVWEEQPTGCLVDVWEEQPTGYLVDEWENNQLVA